VQVLPNKPEDHGNLHRGYSFKVSIAMVFDYVTDSTEVTDMIGSRHKAVLKIVKDFD
jgi:phage regulator Rha-like protein